MVLLTLTLKINTFFLFSIDVAGRIFSYIPGDIQANTTDNLATAAVVWDPPVVVNNTSSFTVTSDYEPGDIFPIGSHVVTYTAVDSSGNQFSVSFSVIVSGKI